MTEAQHIEPCWRQNGVLGTRDCPRLQEHIHCRNCPTYSDAAKRSLNGTLPSDYLEQWTTRLSEKCQSAEPGVESVVIFRVCTETFALSTSFFQEVMDVQSIHSLPHKRSGAVLGLVNVRGELVVCISLAIALRITTREVANSENLQKSVTRLLVAGERGAKIVFPIDEIHGTFRFEPASVKALPSTLANSASKHTKGLLIWRERTVGLLDRELLLRTLTQAMA